MGGLKRRREAGVGCGIALEWHRLLVAPSFAACSAQSAHIASRTTRKLQQLLQQLTSDINSTIPPALPPPFQCTVLKSEQTAALTVSDSGRCSNSALARSCSSLQWARILLLKHAVGAPGRLGA